MTGLGDNFCVCAAEVSIGGHFQEGELNTVADE